MSMRLTTLAFGCALSCASAWAYGPNGHMAVGTIADAMIAGTPAARQVRRILGSNLRTAAVWADCAKGVSPTTFKYAGAGRFPECAIYENPASERQMEAFVRRNVGNCSARFNTEPCHKQYHYTDVAIQRDAYRRGSVGTSNHDVVAAIDACIELLRGHPAPPPFDIHDKREALRLLVHLVGDVHQPLHVVAIYLDANGRLVDPDLHGLDRRSKTRGGNDLWHDDQNLHAEWDSIPRIFKTRAFLDRAVVEARRVLPTAKPVSDWAGLWATDTLKTGKRAFEDVRYSTRDDGHRWTVTLPVDYSATRERVQRDRLIKAGARLAQLLQAILP